MPLVISTTKVSRITGLFLAGITCIFQESQVIEKYNNLTCGKFKILCSSSVTYDILVYKYHMTFRKYG